MSRRVHSFSIVSVQRTHVRAEKTHTSWGVCSLTLSNKLKLLEEKKNSDTERRDTFDRVSDGEKRFCRTVKTGKAVWWVSLISVWLRPSWLPALMASLASAGWLLCPHLVLLTHTQTARYVNFVPSWNKHIGRYWLSHQVFLRLSCVGRFVTQGSCFLSAAHRFYTSCLSFPSDFSSRAPSALSSQSYLQSV